MITIRSYIVYSKLSAPSNDDSFPYRSLLTYVSSLNDRFPKKFKNCKSIFIGKINLKIFKKSIVISGCLCYEDALNAFGKAFTDLENDEYYFLPIMVNSTKKISTKILDLYKLYEVVRHIHYAYYDCNLLKIVIPIDCVDDLPVHLSSGSDMIYKEFYKLGLVKQKTWKITLTVFYTGSIICRGFHEDYDNKAIDWLESVLKIHDFEKKIL